ncbi:ribbon-helix-helix protein, CopG family [Haloarchaeobius sp. HRN-SO-5]|uniref:ribbon-helix-helix protein, CopG family n=1 Tax=Haloarchaeobius sp. HRN-SO-5 TaxID=3446118 RepID=UPI003EBC549B
MGNKNKTVSFRVNEDAFETLQEIAEERDISLSAVFRDYVDMLVAHDGQVAVVPEHEAPEEPTDDESWPPTVQVQKSFLREHERLELETEHLREQLDEYKQYVTHLRELLDDQGEEEVIHLDELDGDEDEEAEDAYRLG